ncbi:MAG: hypothetical protein ACIAS6_03995 [Phycisphaerales bacterium JB060]
MTYEQSARADSVALPKGAAVTEPRLRVVLRRLADHANERGEAWPSAPTLAGQDMDEKTARNALGILEAAGLIRKLSRGARGYRYALCDEIVTGQPTRSESGQPARPETGRPTRSPETVTGRHARHDRATHPPRPGDPPGKTTKNQSGTNTTNGQHATASNGATLPAADAGGGDSLSGAGGFDGDLAGAIDALAALGVNGATDLAERAGSDRTVAWVVEQAKAPGVKNRGAMAAKLIRDGERPSASWRPKAEREAAPAHPALMTDRAPHAAKAERDRERVQAELALIARFPDIAQAAAERFISEGGPFASQVARKPAPEQRTHPRARPAVLAAIEAETGERAAPGATNNARPKRAQELAR